MFRRKEDGTEILDEMDDSVTPLGSPSESASTSSYGATSASSAASTASLASSPAAQTAASSATAFRPAAPAAAMAARMPQSSPTTPSAVSMQPSAASVSQPLSTMASTPKSSKRVLTVGPDIQMKGEITTCDRVVIEGAVDATLRDVHTVELAQSGSLKGTAEVEDAEISGSFEGDLTVSGRLIIYSTGVIRGNVTYGEIEIERGGQISGNVRNVDEAASGKAGEKRRAA